MNLHVLLHTENECYKAGRKIVPKGIMVHSTGANNPMLNRYVGPDDGLLGKNKYGNHWNRPMDRKICCHAFIGKLADGSVATYQILPWDHRGWHGASGPKGSCNNTHIGFEICEDGLTDPVYFGQIYQEAVELCVLLCKEFNLTEKNIIDHREGYLQGIASNHGDVRHWFSKHGKTMDDFRAAVQALLVEAPTEPPVDVPPVDVPPEDEPVTVPTVEIVSNGGDVNLRMGNDTQYPRIRAVGPGSRYPYVATAPNGWHAVALDNQIGWVSGKYSKVLQPAQ